MLTEKVPLGVANASCEVVGAPYAIEPVQALNTP
jgi:hypothetical protein